jgi:signal peptidase II
VSEGLSDVPKSATSKQSALAGYRWFWLLTGIIYLSDQLSKSWIAGKISYPTYGEENGAIVIIHGFMNLVHVGNTGAAWSMFHGNSIALAVLAFIALLAIFIWRKTIGLKATYTQICFGLLCGGILGNLTDRINHGYVVDFIDLHFGNYIYPTFNMADSGICVGVFLYLIESFKTKE